MPDSALKPCPFCAGTKLHKSTRRESGHGESFEFFRVGCNECGALVEVSDWLAAGERGKALVIEKWNRRALPDPAAGEPELPDVDDLAQEIRRVDGNHSLGAGALAEALHPFIRAYGQAMAEHATRAAMEELRECRDLLSAFETCSRNNLASLAMERIEAIDAIRAAAPPQGEPK